MSKFISKAALSRLSGVSRSAITKAANTFLSDAVVNGKINVEHEIVAQWLASKNVHINAKPLVEVSKVPVTIGGVDFKELENLTIKDVVMLHGTKPDFKTLVDSLNTISALNFRKFQIERQRSKLIDCELVTKSILSLLDVAYERLALDLPSMLIQKVITRIKRRGNDVASDIESLIRNDISHELKSTKRTVISSVR